MSNPQTGPARIYRPALLGVGVVLLAVLVALSGPLGSRIGVWDYDAAVRLMTWSAWGFVAGGLLCLYSLFATRPGTRRRGFVLSLIGVLITAPTLGLLYYWQDAKRSYPPIQDISTDPHDPPEFWSAPNSRVYDTVTGSAYQMEFYPDIEPLYLKVPPARAYALALQVVREKGWELQEDNPEALHLEATETTFWFGFSDDVVIHVTPTDDGGSRVDMRSASRFGGGGDGGTNARRIRAFLERLGELAGA